MRTFLVGVMIVLLTLSASAQGMFGGGGKRHHQQKSEEAKKPKENLPVLTPLPNNQPVGKFDPWQNVRSNDSGKTGKNPL